MPDSQRLRAPRPTDDDPDMLWDVEDLVLRKIVRSWSDLMLKQRKYDFPAGLILAGKRRYFRAPEVRAWVKAREALNTKYRTKG